MKRILLTLWIFALSCGANAQDKIDGAFGIKLGDVFDPTKAIGRAELTDGTPMYQFSPASPFRSLKRYYVLITPKTNRVYSIWAIGDFPNTPTAQKEQELILEILRQKYGEKQKEGLMDSVMDVKRIDQGDRNILLKVSGFTDVTLDVRYYDDPLRKEAEKERLELEAKKVDSSGL